MLPILPLMIMPNNKLPSSPIKDYGTSWADFKRLDESTSIVMSPVNEIINYRMAFEAKNEDDSKNPSYVDKAYDKIADSVDKLKDKLLLPFVIVVGLLVILLFKD